LFGTPVSDTTVATMTRRAAHGVTGFLGQVADRLAEAEVVGFDETGLRVAGGLAWVHCARTDRYTLITCHPKRGRAGTDAAGVLRRFRGIAVHDTWAPYDTYTDVTHQLCCAHAVPELRAAAELGPRHLDQVLAEYTAHYNTHRPHRSPDQRPPSGRPEQAPESTNTRHLRRDRLGALIHEYLQVA